MEENKKRKNTKKQRQKEGKGKFEQCAWIGDNKSWAQREYSLLQKNINIKQKASTSRLVINYIVGRVTLFTKL